MPTRTLCPDGFIPCELGNNGAGRLPWPCFWRLVTACEPTAATRPEPRPTGTARPVSRSRQRPAAAALSYTVAQRQEIANQLVADRAHAQYAAAELAYADRCRQTRPQRRRAATSCSTGATTAGGGRRRSRGSPMPIWRRNLSDVSVTPASCASSCAGWTARRLTRAAQDACRGCRARRPRRPACPSRPAAKPASSERSPATERPGGVLGVDGTGTPPRQAAALATLPAGALLAPVPFAAGSAMPPPTPTGSLRGRCQAASAADAGLKIVAPAGAPGSAPSGRERWRRAWCARVRRRIGLALAWKAAATRCVVYLASHPATLSTVRAASDSRARQDRARKRAHGRNWPHGTSLRIAPMKEPEFHRIRRLPPYVFAEVNRHEGARPRRRPGHHRSRHGQSRPADRRRTSSTSWSRPCATRETTATRPRAASPACARRWPAITRAASASSSIPRARSSSRSARRRASPISPRRSPRPGDTILVPNPSYPIHPFGFIIAGASIRHVPFGAGDRPDARSSARGAPSIRCRSRPRWC